MVRVLEYRENFISKYVMFFFPFMEKRFSQGGINKSIKSYYLYKVTYLLAQKYVMNTTDIQVANRISISRQRKPLYCCSKILTDAKPCLEVKPEKHFL